MAVVSRVCKRINCQAISARLFSSTDVADTSDEVVKVGFIGLGNMGRRMAANLHRASYPLVIYDDSAKALDELKDLAVEKAGSPAEVAATDGVRVVITMLPSPQAVREVYMGSEGILSAVSEHGGLRPSLLIDSSTIDPPTAQQVAQAVHSTPLGKSSTPFPGCRSTSPSMIDAPVSGGTTGASAATLSFMVGGDADAFKAAQPFLKAMGKHPLYCGAAGMGQTAKVCNNLALGIQMASVAEALTLGVRLGLDATTLSAIFNASSARCWSSEAYNPAPGVVDGTPASRNYEGGFATKLMVKDIGLAAAAAGHVGMQLPMGEAALKLYEQVAEHNNKLDFGAIYKFAYSQPDAAQ